MVTVSVHIKTCIVYLSFYYLYQQSHSPKAELILTGGCKKHASTYFVLCFFCISICETQQAVKALEVQTKRTVVVWCNMTMPGGKAVVLSSWLCFMNHIYSQLGFHGT